MCRCKVGVTCRRVAPRNILSTYSAPRRAISMRLGAYDRPAGRQRASTLLVRRSSRIRRRVWFELRLLAEVPHAEVVDGSLRAVVEDAGRSWWEGIDIVVLVA